MSELLAVVPQRIDAVARAGHRRGALCEGGRVHLGFCHVENRPRNRAPTKSKERAGNVGDTALFMASLRWLRRVLRGLQERANERSAAARQGW